MSATNASTDRSMTDSSRRARLRPADPFHASETETSSARSPRAMRESDGPTRFWNDGEPDFGFEVVRAGHHGRRVDGRRKGARRRRRRAGEGNRQRVEHGLHRRGLQQRVVGESGEHAVEQRASRGRSRWGWRSTTARPTVGCSSATSDESGEEPLPRAWRRARRRSADVRARRRSRARRGSWTRTASWSGRGTDPRA